nr:transposase [Allocoleopsis franciscana]
MKLLTELLNIKGIKVISHRQHEGIGIIVQVELIGKESNCPRCGAKSRRLHQNHRHIVKDLPWGEMPVFLEINRRQFKCEKCEKPFSEQLEFVSSRRTYTKRLANQIIQDVLENDIHSVAKKGVVTTAEIERMLKDASKDLLKIKPIDLKRLGIDEIALIKGKGNYCAVLVDLIKTAKCREEKAEHSPVLEGLKKSKYVLLKNESDLSEQQKVKLIQVKNVSLTLKRMHELKEQIRQIFTQTQHWLAGLFHLGGWLKQAKSYFPDSQKTIIRWLDEIIAYFDNRTTSGVVEGINNKLKLIKRSAYGFRNFDNYRIRCLLNWHFIC